MVYRPNDSIRTDGYGHLPEYCDKGRCRYCTKGTSRMKCVKCEVTLCFNQARNCFTQFNVTKKGGLVPKEKEEGEDTEEGESEEGEVDADLEDCVF